MTFQWLISIGITVGALIGLACAGGLESGQWKRRTKREWVDEDEEDWEREL